MVPGLEDLECDLFLASVLERALCSPLQVPGCCLIMCSDGRKDRVEQNLGTKLLEAVKKLLPPPDVNHTRAPAPGLLSLQWLLLQKTSAFVRSLTEDTRAQVPSPLQKPHRELQIQATAMWI